MADQDKMAAAHAAINHEKNAAHDSGNFDAQPYINSMDTILKAGPLGPAIEPAGNEAWRKYHGPAGGPFNGQT